MSAFWRLAPRGQNRDKWVFVEEDVYQNDALFGVVSGRDSATDPVTFRPANRGKHLGDLLWTGGYGTVASDRMIAALFDAGATGWSTYPIEIVLKVREHEVLDGYQGLAITGRHEDARFTHFEDVPVSEQDEWNEVRAFGADPTPGWDGSDLFAPKDLGTLGAFWVTDRVYQALLEAGVSDFASTPAREVEGSSLRRFHPALDDPAAQAP